jgi:hypothetical protein
MNSNKKGRSTRSKGRQNDGASPTWPEQSSSFYEKMFSAFCICGGVGWHLQAPSHHLMEPSTNKYIVAVLQMIKRLCYLSKMRFLISMDYWGWDNLPLQISVKFNWSAHWSIGWTNFWLWNCCFNSFLLKITGQTKWNH